MRMLRIAVIPFAALAVYGQEATPPTPAQPKVYQVEAGQKIPLTVIKGVSTKNAVAGDTVYLETAFPVVSGGRILIPKGSYVTGSVTDVKRAGKVKGRAELRIRLESLILPTGETHDFRGSIGGLDSESGEKLNSAEGAVEGKGGKLNDLKTVGTGAGYGTMVGGAAGGLATIGQSGASGNDSILKRPLAGSGIGMVSGVAIAYTATLFMRGPDAVLAKGSDIEMVLDRPVVFNEGDLPPGAQAPTPEPSLKRR